MCDFHYFARLDVAKVAKVAKVAVESRGKVAKVVVKSRARLSRLSPRLTPLSHTRFPFGESL